MKNSYSKGYDDIAIRVIKHSANELSSILAEISNQSLEQGVFPDQLKISKVVPIFKAGDKTKVSNYRPISLLSLRQAIGEKIILDSFVFLIKTRYL